MAGRSTTGGVVVGFDDRSKRGAGVGNAMAAGIDAADGMSGRVAAAGAKLDNAALKSEETSGADGSLDGADGSLDCADGSLNTAWP